ncbi:hypothetical protein Mal15_39490 [Stieleria maiorica]|uniref:Uncharacterized protein n=1 Tax=Stieleria maiorica TaxID=2795974 RepID=A0A5B9MF23_9BACT|nr:hypothetical protein [Stieleria maiorica]QEF99882.1 hypothetical protein Mal15_39490 [Stieleria maiorica]
MKSQTLALIVTLAVGSSLVGQEAGDPLRLSPVQVDDVSQPSATERSHADSVPDTSASTGNRPDAADNARGLVRLDKPMSQIELSGLSASAEVSRPGSTPAEVRWMTAAGISTHNELESVTTYARRRLYFEDAALERCGKSDHVLSSGILTNLHSGAKFLVDTALLPFRMIRQRPDELVGALAE